MVGVGWGESASTVRGYLSLGPPVCPTYLVGELSLLELWQYVVLGTVIQLLGLGIGLSKLAGVPPLKVVVSTRLPPEKHTANLYLSLEMIRMPLSALYIIWV